MTPRPGIFVSAVSKELKTARQLVANTLQFLGYEPVWQDIFGTEQGDLRGMLRQKIDDCKGVVQLVGRCYGAEPPAPDEQFGRVSYTQYEALYARQRGKKVWYLFLDEGFPGDAPAPEPPELQELQATYRRRLQADSHLYHPLTSREALEASVLKLRDDLTRLRRGVKQWAAAVIALLVVLVGAVIWIKSGQQQQKQQLAAMQEKMDLILRQGVTQYAEVQGRVRQEQRRGQGVAGVQQRTYEELGRSLGVDPKLLQEKLPRFAKELQTAPSATTYERANAAYVSKDYAEAGRLALAAAHEAQVAAPPKTAEVIKALELAGKAADARIEYADALRNYRDAERLTDRARDALEWAGVQRNIGYVLREQGQYAAAEKAYQGALDEYRRARGEQDEDVLALRNYIAIVVDDQGQNAAAEKEFQDVVALRTRVLGPEHADTLSSRSNLAGTLLEQGQDTAAEKEFRSVLAIEERALGPEHLNTLYARHNLATALAAQGKDSAAEKEFQDVLVIETRVLGPEHPDTLSCRFSLASVLDDEGKHAEAEKELREVLAIQERVLGPEHPETLHTRYNLAGALGDQGKYAEAEKEFRSVLAILEGVLGPGHPDTLRSRAALSWFQLFARDFAGALATAEAGLKVSASNLDLELNRTHALLFLGRTQEAEQIYLKHRGEKMVGTPKTWEEVIFQDFDDLEKAGLTNPEIPRIRELLKPGAKW